MRKKTEDTKTIENWIRGSHWWRSSKVFYVANIFSEISILKGYEHIDRRQVQTVVQAMRTRGEIDKAGSAGYRRPPPSAYWIVHKWGRSLSNAELGIEPTQFGVPV